MTSLREHKVSDPGKKLRQTISGPVRMPKQSQGYKYSAVKQVPNMVKYHKYDPRKVIMMFYMRQTARDYWIVAPSVTQFSKDSPAYNNIMNESPMILKPGALIQDMDSHSTPANETEIQALPGITFDIPQNMSIRPSPPVPFPAGRGPTLAECKNDYNRIRKEFDDFTITLEDIWIVNGLTPAHSSGIDSFITWIGDNTPLNIYTEDDLSAASQAQINGYWVQAMIEILTNVGVIT